MLSLRSGTAMRMKDKESAEKIKKRRGLEGELKKETKEATRKAVPVHTTKA